MAEKKYCNFMQLCKKAFPSVTEQKEVKTFKRKIESIKSTGGWRWGDQINEIMYAKGGGGGELI